MRSSILTIALALAIAPTSCASPARTPAPPPVASETPPRTKDPGATLDDRSLQPAPRPTPEGGGGGGGSAGVRRGSPDGAACLTEADCASGICEGEGCTDDQPGLCKPVTRACTRDLRPYCGCDGKRFDASGSCPGRRYAATGRCT